MILNRRTFSVVIATALIVAPLVCGVGPGLEVAANALQSTSPHPGSDQTSLAAPGAGTGAQANLGNAVAVSGTTLVVGAEGETVNGHKNQGAVYVYRRPSTGWRRTAPIARLTNLPGQVHDDFGYSVAISGRTIVVGDVDASEGTTPNVHTYQGEVDVYVEPKAGWKSMTHPSAILTVATGESSDELGTSVAIAGRTIVSGASGYNDDNSEDFEGKAYVFAEPATGWHTTAHPLATLAPTGDCTSFCQFGGAAALNGTTIAVSAVGRFDDTGEVYLFHLPTAAQSAEVNQFTEYTGSTANEYFGAPIVFEGNTLAVGATGETVGNNAKQGAVLVFNAPGGGWANAPDPLTAPVELYASDGAANDALGEGLAIWGRAIVAAAPNRSVGKNLGFAGTVYLFERTGSAWTNSTQLSKIGSSTPMFGDYLGQGSLALDGTTLAAGADGRHTEDGAVYVFAPPGPTISKVGQAHRKWAAGSHQPAINTSTYPADGTRFGFTLSRAGTVTLVVRHLIGRRSAGFGHIRYAAPAGRNVVFFDGRLGSRIIKSGPATATISVTNAYGTSTDHVLKFTVT